MVLLWTRSDYLGPNNDVITWGFDHETSHFAIKFYGGAATRIVHNTILGGRRIDGAEGFLKHRNIIKFIEVLLPNGWEELAYNAVTGTDKAKAYDKLYLLWLIGAALKYKLTGVYPTEVGLDSPAASICHELVEYLPAGIDLGVDFDRAWMPDVLYDLLIEKWGSDIIDLRGLG